ncbi:MAG: hypothetical protein QG628_808 [Patescibacteria group bacterium]|jgi:esterase/lipase|nr:hypothetical protein [Patescibacteria group bacterium]
MSSSIYTSREFGDEVAAKAALLVAGYNGRIADVETAAISLADNGFNVIAYDFNPDAINSGNPDDLPKAIQELTEDFRTRTLEYQTIQPAGVSMGAGFAWATQKRSETEPETDQIILPGIYAAEGANSADGIFVKPSNPVMYAVVRGIRKAYEDKGYDHEALRDAWSEIHKPPKSGFAVVLGGLDYVVRYREIMRNIDMWKTSGIPIKTLTRRAKAHAGTIDWYNHNIPTMLTAVKSLDQQAHPGSV